MNSIWNFKQKKNFPLSRSTQRAVLQKSCSTVGIFAGKIDSVFRCCWQDEMHLLGDFFENFLLNGHYCSEAAKICFGTFDNL